MSPESPETTLDRPVSTPLFDRVRAEYLEAPGLALTAPQVQRLFGLEVGMGEVVLSQLLDLGFLIQDLTGRFRKRSEAS